MPLHHYAMLHCKGSQFHTALSLGKVGSCASALKIPSRSVVERETSALQWSKIQFLTRLFLSPAVQFLVYQPQLLAKDVREEDALAQQLWELEAFIDSLRPSPNWKFSGLLPWSCHRQQLPPCKDLACRVLGTQKTLHLI